MAWTWLRPDWLYALALPLALLLAAALPSRPVDVPVGAIAVWRRIAERAHGERGRRRPPLELLCVVAALALATLALARPVRSSAASVERWQVIVDTSPSGALPWNGTSRPRLVVAAEALASWARERSASLERTIELEWQAGGGAEGPIMVSASELSSAASALVARLSDRPDFASAAEPDWALHDRAGVLWLTDHARDASVAGVFASGGDAVPGPIGEDAGRAIVWGADGALALGDTLPPGSFVLRGNVAPELALVAELFAAERGLALVGDADAANGLARLTLRAPVEVTDALSEWVSIGRDGWRARVRGAPMADAPSSAAWLTDAQGQVWCRYAPGVVAVDVLELELEPSCGPAFAASWAALFDRALLPASGTVPFAERQAAGVTVVRPPAGDAVLPLSDERRERAPWFGALAALAALCALGLQSRR